MFNLLDFPERSSSMYLRSAPRISVFSESHLRSPTSSFRSLTEAIDAWRMLPRIVVSARALQQAPYDVLALLSLSWLADWNSSEQPTAHCHVSLFEDEPLSHSFKGLE